MSAITRHRVIQNHEPSYFLRASMSAIPRLWETEGVHACPHMRDDINAGSTRLPGITALWAPRCLTCVDCSVGLRLTGAADRTCDRCQHVVPLDQTIAGLIYDTKLAGRRLMILFGLCPDCLDREGIG